MNDTTTTITDLGNGWRRQGQSVIWTSGPRGAFIGPPVRDLLRLSVWHAKGEPLLRIEIDHIANDDDPADLGGLFDRFGSSSADLPVAALPELAYWLTRILGAEAIYAVVERINSERGDYLKRLFDAVGGDPGATLAEAEAALKAQET
jgi:hypothetical protein